MKTGRLLELRGAFKGHLSTDRKIDLGVPTATKQLHAAHDHQSACLSQENFEFSGFQSHHRETTEANANPRACGRHDWQSRIADKGDLSLDNKKNRKKCLAESMPVERTIGNSKKL